MSRGDDQAFPVPIQWRPDGECVHGGHGGLTIREEFAARMLAAMLEKSILSPIAVDDLREWRIGVAVEYADALIERLAR